MKKSSSKIKERELDLKVKVKWKVKHRRRYPRVVIAFDDFEIPPLIWTGNSATGGKSENFKYHYIYKSKKSPKLCMVWCFVYDENHTMHKLTQFIIPMTKLVIRKESVKKNLGISKIGNITIYPIQSKGNRIKRNNKRIGKSAAQKIINSYSRRLYNMMDDTIFNDRHVAIYYGEGWNQTKKTIFSTLLISSHKKVKLPPEVFMRILGYLQRYLDVKYGKGKVVMNPKTMWAELVLWIPTKTHNYKEDSINSGDYTTTGWPIKAGDCEDLWRKILEMMTSFENSQFDPIQYKILTQMRIWMSKGIKGFLILETLGIKGGQNLLGSKPSLQFNKKNIQIKNIPIHGIDWKNLDLAAVRKNLQLIVAPGAHVAKIWVPWDLWYERPNKHNLKVILLEGTASVITYLNQHKDLPPPLFKSKRGLSSFLTIKHMGFQSIRTAKQLKFYHHAYQFFTPDLISKRLIGFNLHDKRNGHYGVPPKQIWQWKNVKRKAMPKITNDYFQLAVQEAKERFPIHTRPFISVGPVNLDLKRKEIIDAFLKRIKNDEQVPPANGKLLDAGWFPEEPLAMLGMQAKILALLKQKNVRFKFERQAVTIGGDETATYFTQIWRIV